MLVQNDQDEVTDWLIEALKRSENSIDSILRFNYKVVKIDTSDPESFTSESCKLSIYFYSTELYFLSKNPEVKKLCRTSQGTFYSFIYKIIIMS